MPTILFVNDAQTTLAGAISDTATSLTVAAGTGNLFPVPGADEYFVITLSSGSLKEIAHATARSGDTLTVVRAQEGTTALAWAAGSLVSNFWTAGQAALIMDTSNDAKASAEAAVAISEEIVGELSGLITEANTAIDAANTATENANTATAAVYAAGTGTLAQIATAETDALAAVSAAETSAVNSVNTAGTTQVGNVNSAGSTQVGAVNTAGSTQVSAVNSAGSTQVTAVGTAGTTQIGLVNTAGSTQVAAVNSAGSTQVSAVNTAGATQITAVNAAGTQQLANLAMASGLRLFPTTAAALSNGVLALTITAAGSGGTNGQFDLSFSGGGGTLASGRFLVVGGAISSVTRGFSGQDYATAPTVSVSASSGLSGATVVATIGPNAPVGSYFCIPGTNGAALDVYLVVTTSSVQLIEQIPGPLTPNTLLLVSQRYATQVADGARTYPALLPVRMYMGTLAGGAAKNADGTYTLPANATWTSPTLNFAPFNAPGNLYFYVVATTATRDAIQIKMNQAGTIIAAGSATTQPNDGVYKQVANNSASLPNPTVEIKNVSANPITIYCWEPYATDSAYLPQVLSFADNDVVVPEYRRVIDWNAIAPYNRWTNTYRGMGEGNITSAFSSVNGSDGNAGTRFSPKQNLTAGTALSSGAIVGFERASVWNQAVVGLGSTTQGIALRGYANGKENLAFPRINGGLDITANSWTSNEGGWKTTYACASNTLNNTYSPITVVQTLEATKATLPIASTSLMTAQQVFGTFVGSISGTTMTVTAVTVSGITAFLGIGANIVQAQTEGTTIVSQLTSTEPGGALGGRGTYQITPSQTVGAGTTMFACNTIAATGTGAISGTTFAADYPTAGAWRPGQVISGSGVTAGTTIVSQTSGPVGGAGNYVVSASQTVAGGTVITATSAPAGSSYAVKTAATTVEVTVWPLDGLIPGSSAYSFTGANLYLPVDWGASGNVRSGFMYDLWSNQGNYGYGGISGGPQTYAQNIVTMNGWTHTYKMEAGRSTGGVAYNKGSLGNTLNCYISPNANGYSWLWENWMVYESHSPFYSHNAAGTYVRGDYRYNWAVKPRATGGQLESSPVFTCDSVAFAQTQWCYTQGYQQNGRAGQYGAPVTGAYKNNLNRELAWLWSFTDTSQNITQHENWSDPSSSANRNMILASVSENHVMRNNTSYARNVSNTLADYRAEVMHVTINAGLNMPDMSYSLWLVDTTLSVNGTYLVQGINANRFTSDWNAWILCTPGNFLSSQESGPTKTTWADYLALFTGHDVNSKLWDLRDDPRGAKAVFVDPANGDFRWAPTRSALEIATYCKTYNIGANWVITNWPTVPTVDEAARLLMAA